MTIPKRIAAMVLAALVGALSAGGQAVELTRDQAVIDAGAINDFAKGNLPSFTTSRLANGIPVIIKRSATNRILSLKVVLRGHVSFTPPAKAGLEAAMLTMLTRGSARYAYADFQRALFETSASISPGAGSFDMTSFNLTTIDTYFTDLFPVFADAFLHPAWNAEEFPRVMGDMKLGKQEQENDPYALAVEKLNEVFFAGHPYAASWGGAGDSLDGITLDDVKAYYARNVSAARIFIVAVGNFDPSTLLPLLNASFGAMGGAAFARPPVPSFAGTVKPYLIVHEFPASTGLAYVRGDFAMPGPESPDYAPSLVAFSLLNDVLFEIVRTRNGACYSVWAAMHGFTASYGDITVFKTAMPGLVKPLVDQAIAVLASGRSMGGNVSASAAGKSGIGSAADTAKAGSFVPIVDALPFYRAKALTEFYAGQQTNTSVAAQIASSVVYAGDYRDYLLMRDRIQAVSADDVVRVTKKYLVANPALWIVLGDPALLKTVKKSDFLAFTAP